MDIKDSYLHGSVGVVKSIDINADTLTYTLANNINTSIDVKLPIATTSANGLLSKEDKLKLDTFKANSLDYHYTFGGGGDKKSKYCYVGSIILDSGWEGHHAIYSFTGFENSWSGILYIGFRTDSEAKQITGCNIEWLSLTDQNWAESIYLTYTTSDKTCHVYVLMPDNYRNTYISVIFNESLLTFNASASYSDNYNGTLIAKSIGNKALTATTATKLSNSRNIWGQPFDGAANISGNMTGVGTINDLVNIVNDASSVAKLHVKDVYALVDYVHLYVSNLDNSRKDRSLVLQNGFGNVGIGTPIPSEKLEVNGNIKATSFIGNVSSDKITLTNYTKATTTSSIATTDSLTTALGKLEYKTDFIYSDLLGGDDNDDIINKWSEIVDFIKNVKEGADITDEFVTRKTNLTIIGVKTFEGKSENTNDIVVPLILKNSGWKSHISTAIDFYNGSMYTEPNARISTYMNGGGSRGGTLIFYTQQLNDVNPNPNGLTERLRIGDDGITKITGNLTVTNELTATKFKTSGGTSSQFVKGDGSLSTIYAPTSAGSKGLVLISNGSGAPTWSNIAVNKLNNYYSSRPTSLNPGITGDGSMFLFKSTSSINDGTHPGDGHILHFNWDNTGGWDSQIFVRCSLDPTLKIRSMGSGTWSDWKEVAFKNDLSDFITTTDLSNYVTIDTTLTITGNKTFTNLITSNGGITSTGNLTLFTNSGNSPHLIFLRGNTDSDDLFDWRVYVVSGLLKFEYNNKGTWNTGIQINLNILTAGSFNTGSYAGSWVSGMTNAAIKYNSLNTISGNYHPILGIKTTGNNVVNIGAYLDNVGFYGFKSGRTANAVDWSFIFDSNTGNVTSTGTIAISNGNVTSKGGFIKSDITNADNYVLLAGGGHKSLSEIVAKSLQNTIIIQNKAINLGSAAWSNVGYTFTNLESGTYAIQITSTNLVASGIMSVYKNLTGAGGDEIPLHVYTTAGWRPYLRTYQNNLLISSNDSTSTSRTVTIKIAKIL